MAKIERLNVRVEKLLSKVVQEVLDVVKETVCEYQEKTARTQRENQSLKRRLQELQDRINLESNGTKTKDPAVSTSGETAGFKLFKSSLMCVFLQDWCQKCLHPSQQT